MCALAILEDMIQTFETRKNMNHEPEIKRKNESSIDYNDIWRLRSAIYQAFNVCSKCIHIIMLLGIISSTPYTIFYCFMRGYKMWFYDTMMQFFHICSIIINHKTNFLGISLWCFDGLEMNQIHIISRFYF